ncbi:MAG: acyl-CoA thioesterase [Saprospiraceae bacterium]|nr:acyl-CoA thioesterase [Saprospiraceae bacterium]
MSLRAKKVSESETIMSEMIMPNDTNSLGNLMGGNLLRWMDIAGAICAGKHCERSVVTASVDHVSFKLPIPVGDVITIKASATRAFSTSVEIFVEVFSADIKGGNSRRCNDAYYTFVGLDDASRRPVTIPPVLPLSREEQELYNGALQRRELRLILSGRMKPEEATEIKSLFLKK